MFRKSTTRRAARRLRLEFLETREVPDAAPTDIKDPPPTDPTVPVQTAPADTTTDTGEPLPDGGNLEDPTVIFQTTSAPQESPAVDLGVSITADKPKPSLNELITFKVTLTNNGPVQSTGSTVNVTLPAGMTFVSASAATGFDPSTGAWTPGTVASKGTAVLSVKARLTDTASQSVTAAVGGADQADDKADNNSASVTLSPVLARLKMSKSFSATSVGVGGTAVMTVAVGNGGQGKARDVVVDTTLPEGITLVRILSSTQGSFTGNGRSWNVGSVAPGAIAVLRLLVIVNKEGKHESPSVATASGIDTTTSKLDATGAITGTKWTGPAGWSYYGGPNFSINPGPVPVAAKSVSPWAGAVINNQFLASHGFAMSGFKVR